MSFLHLLDLLFLSYAYLGKGLLFKSEDCRGNMITKDKTGGMHKISYSLLWGRDMAWYLFSLTPNMDNMWYCSWLDLPQSPCQSAGAGGAVCRGLRRRVSTCRTWFSSKPALAYLTMDQYLYIPFLGDEHPFTSYFDVHQGYKVLTHCHLTLISWNLSDTHTHTGCWWVMTNASMWSMVPTCFSTKIHVANSSVGLGWCWCHFLFGLFTLCLPSWHCRMGHIPILSSETHMFFRVWEFLTKHTSQLHGLWRYCLLNNHKID